MHLDTITTCGASYFAGLATDWLLHAAILAFGGLGWFKAWRRGRHHRHEHPTCDPAPQILTSPQIEPDRPWERA